jgi:hypothetical protein
LLGFAEDILFLLLRQDGSLAAPVTLGSYLMGEFPLEGRDVEVLNLTMAACFCGLLEAHHVILASS